MGVRKRVSALLLAVLLSFGVCAVDYLQVDALEVGGSVVWDTAINYLLGLLGLSPIAENGDKIVDFDAMRSKWVQDYEAYFYANVQPEDLPDGYTKERAYQNWIDNVCRGNLNTVEYGAWDIFKEWAETLVGESSGGGSVGSGSLGTSFTVSECVSYVANVLGYQNCSTTLSGTYYGYTASSLNTDGCFLNLIKNPTYTIMKFNNSDRFVFYDSNNNPINYYFDTIIIRPNSVTSTFSSFNSRGGAVPLSIGSTGYGFVLGADVIDLGNLNTTAKTDFNVLGGDVVVPSDSDYAVVNDKITDLQIINDYSTTTTQNVVSIDWDKIGAMINDAVGTVTGSLDRTITGALDDAQEKVAAGSMSVANYNDYVTEISNTYVYDITNETSITNPDSTVTGVISGNVENAEFVLKGLQYVFPFCIPWDIKDFVTLLVADPVAPVIEYPIYNPVTDTDEIITIDFSLWENQVRIIRYIFDFLLIIGLLLLARSLIGAGGSD